MASTTTKEHKDLEDIVLTDDLKKQPKTAAVAIESERCTKCIFGWSWRSTPKTPAELPKIATRKRSREVTARAGIDVASVVESKIFQELSASLAKRKGFEVVKIHIQSVVTKLRAINCDYVVLRDAGLPVNETQKRASPVVKTLDVNTVVKVLEIADEEDDGRLRARIESPAGWISLSHQAGTTYAKQREAIHDITYMECLVDAKINGKSVPGILFMRGSAVAILIVLHVDNGAGAERQKYTLLVQQDGIPSELAASMEIPAGTIDASGKFSGAVAKDILEKTAIDIKRSDLVDVTEATYKDATPDMLPCLGAQKFDKVFLLQESTTAADLQSLTARLRNQKDGEMKLQLEPLEKTLEKQTRPAFALYDKLEASGRIRDVYSKEWHFSKAVGAAVGKILSSFS
jgi:hypothetical protein